MPRVVLFVAIRQLWDRKLLNGIAVLGVMLGVLTLVAVRGMMDGFQTKFLGNMLRISPQVTILDKELRPASPLLSRFTDDFVAGRISHESPSDRQLAIRRPNEIVRALERMDGVTAAAVSIGGTALLAYGAKQYPIELRGIEPMKQDRVTPIADYMVQGSYAALSAETEGILLGAGVAAFVGAKLGDLVTVGTPIGETLSLKVVGIYEAGIPPIDKNRAYTTLKTAQVLLGKPDVVGRIDVKLDDPELASAMAADIERMFHYDAVSWQEQNANFLSIFRQMDTVIALVIGAILSVAGFGILATQVMIVLQKTRDIAILRSVGFRRKDILGAFLIQGAIIAVVGGILGDVAAHYILSALSRMRTQIEGLVKSDHFLVHDDPRMYVYGLLFALVVGVLASIVPAARAARVQPVDVLRGLIG